MTVSIALYQPDIAGNTGTILRLGACMGVGVHVIEPAGFDLSDRNLKRAGMDYIEQAALTRHLDFAAFDAARMAKGQRLVLMTTSATADYLDFAYHDDDILLFGRESVGVPPHVHQRADARLTIAMQPGARSLNLAVSAAITLGEALRQTRRHP